jgi:hypothetical protein
VVRPGGAVVARARATDVQRVTIQNTTIIKRPFTTASRTRACTGRCDGGISRGVHPAYYYRPGFHKLCLQSRGRGRLLLVGLGRKAVVWILRRLLLPLSGVRVPLLADRFSDCRDAGICL